MSPFRARSLPPTAENRLCAPRNGTLQVNIHPHNVSFCVCWSISNDDFSSTLLCFVVLIEFLTEHGDLPMLRADVSKLDMNGEYVFDSFYTGNFMLNITEYQRGTTQDVECSGTGICDTKEGRCHCMEGFFSSNGSVYAPGETGDCSYFNPYYTIDALVNGQPRNRKQRRGLDTNA